ncbi:MAG: glycosyltransferase [Candidatus Omnitrophica bacterium]|nr:glycosyltransferase [Candidatus Omnitrophota bacterium]
MDKSSLKKVLLMYISEESGHHRASLAIEKALKIIEPNIDTLNINAFNYTNPILEKIINKTYIGIIKRTPEMWEYLYDNPKIVKNTQGLRDLIHKFNSGKLMNLLEDFYPSVICCTQAFPCGMVADYKKTYGFPVSLIAVLTDYMPHSYWIYDNVDYYIVPSEDTKLRLIENGIPNEKIRVFGIPVDPGFSNGVDRKFVFNRIGLNETLPVVLLMGGSQGLGPMAEIALSLDRLKIEFQLVIICGHNSKLKKFLERKRGRFKKSVLIFEYVDNINEFMAISSLIITKPGGLTTAEALSRNLPMVIVNPIPGQETNNTNFLLKTGVALKAESEDDISVLTLELLNSRNKLNQMKELTKNVSKPNASIDLAKFILQLL